MKMPCSYVIWRTDNSHRSNLEFWHSLLIDTTRWRRLRNLASEPDASCQERIFLAPTAKLGKPSMAMSRPAPRPCGNKLLDLLEETDFRRLQPHLELVPLDFKQILYDPGKVIEYAYFPREGVTSMLTLMEDGSGIELATIGREGMVGLDFLLGEEKALARSIAQVPGTAFRVKGNIIREETSRVTSVRRLLFLYHRAFLKQIMQAVACNGLHPLLQRCCRWLLMTRDRVDSDRFVMTHEFLAEMLGVRRSSVSEALEPLQKKNLIHYHRGKIKILNRKGLEAFVCECYWSIKGEFDRLFAGKM
jgi:CRP-like cAMP-binding protein